MYKKNMTMILINFQDQAKKKFGFENMSDTGPGFKENFAQIGIYFQSLNTRWITEEPTYTVSHLQMYVFRKTP